MKANSGKIIFLGGPMHGRVVAVSPDDRGLGPVRRALVPPPSPSMLACDPTEAPYELRTIDYWLRYVRTGNAPEQTYRFYIAKAHRPEEWLDLLLSVAEQKSEKCLTPSRASATLSPS